MVASELNSAESARLSAFAQRGEFLIFCHVRLAPIKPLSLATSGTHLDYHFEGVRRVLTPPMVRLLLSETQRDGRDVAKVKPIDAGWAWRAWLEPW